MTSSQDQSRRSRLNHLFRDVLSGKRLIRTAQDAQLFLEAVRAQEPPSKCAEMLVSSNHGLEAIRNAIRLDVSRQFILSHTLPWLRYLSDPGIKALVNGQLLGRLIEIVTHPSTVIDALIALFEADQIPDEALYPFAWLSLEIMNMPPGGLADPSRLIACLLASTRLIKCEIHETRELGYRIQKTINMLSKPVQSVPGGPGGRHDNDHEDIRDIAIYPTTDEFLSSHSPYYRTLQEITETPADQRVRAHIDNQFRLLREDMLAELREDIQIATGKKKGRRKVLVLGQLAFKGIDMKDGADRYKKSTLLLRCGSGLECLDKYSVNERRKFLRDHPSILRHQTFGVFCNDNKDIVAFAFVERNIDDLVMNPPIVSLQMIDHEHLGRALLALATNKQGLQFLPVDTPVFAYEPVLCELQRMTAVPLLDLLINPAAMSSVNFEVPTRLLDVVTRLREGLERFKEGASSIRIKRPDKKAIDLDESQLRALLGALSNPVTLIQGPPGTGKSFIGAEIIRRMYEAGLTIAVFTYTNHALDQFVEDLRDAGIPISAMVRIGSRSKCSNLASQILLSEQKSEYKRSQASWAIIKTLKNDAGQQAVNLEQAVKEFAAFEPSWKEVFEYLEFADGCYKFFNAFQVPEDQSGWKKAGKKNKAVGPNWLFRRWKDGQDAGFLKEAISPESKEVWAMSKEQRRQHLDRWLRALREERLEVVKSLARQYLSTIDDINSHFAEGDAHVLRQKRIICCTTTAAAKYSRLIRAAGPQVVMMEEAGEILESHTLTALTDTVKQLVLIGDHKQLRPKINNYALSVEKGDGFDLNCSMFERLIKQGVPYVTLTKQHRMAQEISVFPRALTYPELRDGPGTSDRPRILGLRDRVIFVNHNKPEDTDKQLQDRRDPSVKESKRNRFEAEMVLACVTYLGQQGYSTDKMVVLAPYLGQVRILRDLLQHYHDTALSDMDARELIQAGLMSEVSASLTSKPLRVSTIDNYQGEESDIVIASLTRCNEDGDIGFMAAPERLNVLITRARNGLIMLGSMATFLKSKKGSSTWRPFFNLLNEKGHLYDGLPVKCERHPERTALLSDPADFARLVPDGGCSEPCNAPLKCGLHTCSRRCHRVTDHSKTECNQLVNKTCNRKHHTRVQCGKQHEDCVKCIAEDKEAERRAKRDLQLEMERRQREEEYRRKLQEIDDEIEHQRLRNKYALEQEEREKTLEQRRRDLEALKETAQRLKRQNELKAQMELRASMCNAGKQDNKSSGTPATSATNVDTGSSSLTGARAEWEYLKEFEAAASTPMDELMEMIGLEEVKEQFLEVKSKVDTALRQGVSMSNERFSATMLGNPGTGKTTVARLYAQFLTELCVIPGSAFKETTGAALANAGVSGTKDMIEEIVEAGGGVLFIDEAYQLTSGNSYGGGAVLDYLLAEVENLRGKVVFVLAGYNKQMESFFAHNPGLPSRFPIEMKFADYTDEELLKILELKINKKYHCRMKCEEGLTGLYSRIVARRIGRGRGKPGFANARAVENQLDRISRRQADRLRRERRAGLKPDDFLLTKEDLIGPEPKGALANCAAWKELQSLIGLDAVKEAVKSLVSTIEHNYQRELSEQPLIEYSLNKLFLGNPGTGKTTVAKLYGQILVALGMLSNGEVVVKNPSDFVGAALGQSEKNTKGILESTVGKVLVIDEAYGLYGGGDSQGATSDPYKTAVIDTIVAEVQSVPGDDRCVLLLGYKDQMEKMLQNVNPGLSRRFPMASAFMFEDFTDDQLRKILDLKLKKQGYEATDQAKNTAMEMLKRARNRPNFGNGGEVDQLLDIAKGRHQTRMNKGEAKDASRLEARDFDEDFDRAERAETNIRKLFEGNVGSEQVISLLEGYQQNVRTMKALGLDPKENIPFNFLFRGPPGTGKTTTARKMGKVFYDMGFLASTNVVECSATDLIGQYVGQTGPKVQQVLDKALGKVLFVDEAYRLAEGHFAKEAMDEIVDCVTKERYFKKLIIIFAGYEDDINRLMSTNPGLTSRFPDVIDFHPLTGEECIALLLKLFQRQKGLLHNKSGTSFDLSCLENPNDTFKKNMINRFTALAAQKNWANARDVQTLAKTIFNRVMSDTEAVKKRNLVLTETAVTEELDRMLVERAARASSATLPVIQKLGELRQQLPPHQQREMAPPQASSTTVATETATAPLRDETPPEQRPPSKPVTEVTKVTPAQQSSSKVATRDAGVSDEVWEQLQRDKQAAQEREAEVRRLKEEAKKASDDVREKILQRLIEEEKRRLQEQEAREKLAKMGLCPMGYEWIKQSGGWRCAGGSHWVDDGQLGL